MSDNLEFIWYPRYPRQLNSKIVTIITGETVEFGQIIVNKFISLLFNHINYFVFTHRRCTVVVVEQTIDSPQSSLSGYIFGSRQNTSRSEQSPEQVSFKKEVGVRVN